MRKFFTAIMMVTSIVAMAQMSFEDELYGDYEWSYLSELIYDGGKSMVPVEICPGTRPGAVFIKGMYLDYTLVADVNEKDRTLSLRSQSVDYDLTYGSLKLYKVKAEETGFVAYEEPLVAEMKDGSLVFDPDEMIGIGFPDLEGGVYFLLAADNVMAPSKDRTFVYNAEEWETLGTGHMTDGWISYHYLGEEVQAEYDVEIQIHKNTPGRYLVLNPFKNEIWADYNQDPKAEGYMVFDASNPKIVLFEPCVYSGFTDAEFGKLYMYSSDSNYHFVQGYTKDELLELMPNQLGHIEDNVLIVPQPAFGHEARPMGHYGWGMLVSYLELPKGELGGVSGVIGDSDTTEYYNLQGVKIAQPEHGLYIEKCGSNVKKIMR